MSATPYKVSPEPADPKPRLLRVTDPEEIAAIKRADLLAPIGFEYAGAWFAEATSLEAYRGVSVEGGQPN